MPAPRLPDTSRVSISKVATMRDAIAGPRRARATPTPARTRAAVAGLVRDGDTVAIEGFTHLISFAAGHEIIRQRKRDLTLARLTPALIYDQMIAAGLAREPPLSW